MTEVKNSSFLFLKTENVTSNIVKQFLSFTLGLSCCPTTKCMAFIHTATSQNISQGMMLMTLQTILSIPYMPLLLLIIITKQPFV